MEKRARTLVVQEGDLSFFCPYEPGAKEKMKADRNTDNRLHYLHSGQFLFFSLHAATAAKFQTSRRGV